MEMTLKDKRGIPQILQMNPFPSGKRMRNRENNKQFISCKGDILYFRGDGSYP